VRVAQKLPLILTFSPEEGVEKRLFAVIPAQAGSPKLPRAMDSCLHRNGAKVEILIYLHPPGGRRNTHVLAGA